MATIEQTCELAVPVDFAFEFVNDYRNVPEWAVGISRFQPVGAPEYGVGAVFDVAVSFGPLIRTLELVCVEWVRNELIRVTGVTEPELCLGLRFAAVGAADSTLLIETGHPRLRGTDRAVGKLMAPLVQTALGVVDTRLRRCVAEQYAEHRTAECD
ncbi:SRPBCC family protein [Nocardia sp. NPDC056000]|uniref:SRPBCC family protein n=1 Tax=Nocardia sp. NPDC056000 TaxID=3345674 RepID=UPI0035E0838F